MEDPGAPLGGAERIVLIRPGALGDALLTFPALALLRKARPGVIITFIARGDVLPLAINSNLMDYASPYERPEWSALFAEDPPTHGLAFWMITRAPVVAWLNDPDGTTRRALEHLGAKEIIIAESRPAEGSGLHAALHLARALAPLGVSTPPTADELRRNLPPLRIPAADETAAEAAWLALNLPPDARVVALHAGSGGASKRWPPQSFATLAQRLRESGYAPLLIEGPQDDAITQSIQAALAGNLLSGNLLPSEPLPVAPLPVARDLPIGALASLLRRCSAYLGNDSGVSHLAALADVPTVALFGPSDPALWSPLGPLVSVLRSPTSAMTDITVDEAIAPLRAILPQN